MVKTDYRWSKQTLPTSTPTYTLGGGQNGLSELLEATVETDYKLLAVGQNGLSELPQAPYTLGDSTSTSILHT